MNRIEKTTPADPLRNTLHEYIDKMNEYQLRMLLGFIKKLFNLD